MSDAPRVLLVSPSIFNDRTGGGITLTNLFRGWPRDRIAAVHSDPNTPATGICGNYFKLTSGELAWVWPLSLLMSRADVRPANAAGAGVEGNGTNRIISVARAVKNLIAREGLNDRARITPALRSFVQEFRPDVIYTLLGSLSYLRLVRRLAEFTGAAIVVHMMDDWPSTLYRSGALAPYFRAEMERELEHSFLTAAARLAISPLMAEVYERRYGHPFTAFSNAIDLRIWDAFARRSWKVASSPRIVYSGSVGLNAQRQSLVDMAAAVEAIGIGPSAPALVVHTPQHGDAGLRAALCRFRRTRLKPPLTEQEIGPYLRDSDVLLLPVNFDVASATYVRYSSPTKLPAYMSTGTPILVYGPRSVDQVERAARDGWGLVVDRRDRADLVAAVRQLLEDTGLRERLGRRAHEVVRRDHDAERVRADFRRALTQAAERREAAALTHMG